jgi:hypothetical protein
MKLMKVTANDQITWIIHVICYVQNQFDRIMRKYNVILIPCVFTVDDKGLPILNVDHDIISYRKGEDFPASACATPCAMHQVKIQVGSPACA